MTTLAHQQRSVGRLDDGSVRGVRGTLGGSWRSLGPWRRRAAVSVGGAVVAFAFGAAAADVVRLPSDMSGPPAASDEMTVQSELPSIASARAYALDNPPTYVTPVPAAPVVAPDATTDNGEVAPQAIQAAYDDSGDPPKAPEPQPANARSDHGDGDPDVD